MRTLILQHLHEDGTRVEVYHLETQQSAFPGKAPRGDLVEIESNSGTAAFTYDVLVKVARAIVRHEETQRPKPPDDLTENALDTAVRTILKHKAVNVINSILKVKGTL
jgi:hypothetical protein